MEKGNCRLCGKLDNLSFEHIPPKITFNKTTRYKSIPLLEVLKVDNPLNHKFTSRIEQGGTGYYSLCKECNSFLGANYVNPYNIFVRCIASSLKPNLNNHYVLHIKDLELLKILKQICSMFLSLNDSTFSINNTELVKFVREPLANTLPDRYKLFIYLNTEGNLRHLPFAIKGNFKTKISIACSEITFPPLGYVLTIDYSDQLKYLTEITNFKNYTTKSDIELDLYKLPSYLPILLDYRDKAEIENSISNNR